MAGRGSFSLATYGAAADGVSDDTAALRRCLEDAAGAGGGVIHIPPGDYFLPGVSPLPLPSHTTVLAHGARFHLPATLGEQARVILFAAQDLVDFAWHGGDFQGRCFDHRRPPNSWEPSASTRVFAVTTSRGGRTDNLLFHQVRGRGIAGAVINVEGLPQAGSESEVDTFATNIAVRDCLLTDCGKFMWDYGLLWQILVWPEDYAPEDLATAQKYFSHDLIRGPVGMADGDDRVRFTNTRDPLHNSGSESNDQTVCFFGDRLPANVQRGRKYYIVAAGPDSIGIALAPGGAAIRFEGQAGPEARLIHNLWRAFYALYAPLGAGPGKGGIDLVCCRGTSLTGNRLSALGDTMHLQRCHNNVFAHNQILGSRMGAFFLAEYCRNSAVTGNTVDGGNGSRVMSVEKSNRDVTIIGNTFRSGGRGSWINQPQGIVIQGNIFVDNTTKGEPQPWRGRRSFETGDYERWAEMYFTTHERGGRYGPVILKDNIFVTGPHCSHGVTFATGGHDIIVEGNSFHGPARTVRFEPGCTNVRVAGNLNLETEAAGP